MKQQMNSSSLLFPFPKLRESRPGEWEWKELFRVQEAALPKRDDESSALVD